MSENTPIPPDFPITYCPPGMAQGIDSQVYHSTGRRGAPACLFRDFVGEKFGGKFNAPLRAKKGEGKRYLERKAYREKIRARLDFLKGGK